METDSLTRIPTVAIESSDVRRAFFIKAKGYLLRDALLFLTLTGIVFGFALGFGVRETHPSKDVLMWLGMPGELFLRMLRLMILPLIVCSVISGTASLDPKSNGKISAISFTFIVSTNILACVVALVLCVLIKPGSGGSNSDNDSVNEVMETQDIFADLLRNIFPDNLLEAGFRQAQTKYDRNTVEQLRNTSNGTIVEKVIIVSKSVGKTGGVNVLGVIMACTVLGIAANTLKEKADIFLKFFTAATEIVLVVLRKFFWVAPIGISSLIAVSIAGITDIANTFSQLGMFVLAVTIGILIHSLILLPLILFLTTKRNPFLFIVSIFRPCLIGFASTSTAVAIPEMINSCEEKNKIDKRVARFVIPFCVTLNADGSALYITSAAVFIAQFTETPISAGEIIVIGVLTAIAAMAIPSVPSSSIVTLVIILTSLNIPANDIALLFAVEWFLDRIRTVCNIISHTFCTAVTYQFCKQNLKSLDEKNERKETEMTSLSSV